MYKLCCNVALLVFLAGTGFAASTSVEVLYVAQTQGTSISLLTYHVNPRTAVAQQVGTPIAIAASSIDPLTVGGLHLIYVWNATDVWMYLTDARGLPGNHAAQHLAFNFPHPVTSFVANPNGKFAYAAMTGPDSHGDNHATVVLFTIDQSTGRLTNTGHIVEKYGPDAYTALTDFSFGAVGDRLYARYFDTGPRTCIVGYDYYSVSPATGQLGPRTDLFYAQADCGEAGAAAFTDLLTAAASACCGPGSGALEILRTPTVEGVYCSPSMLAFCGDEPAQLKFDPASRNIFFSDIDTNQVSIGHIDIADSQLLATSSSIPGLPPIYFSPDSRLVYALNADDIGIYALQVSTGELLANTSLAEEGKVSIATATLHR